MHLLFFCTKYSAIRDYFFTKIEHHLPNSKHVLAIDARKELMNSSDYHILLKLTLSRIDLRRDLLSTQGVVTLL